MDNIVSQSKRLFVPWLAGYSIIFLLSFAIYSPLFAICLPFPGYGILLFTAT